MRLASPLEIRKKNKELTVTTSRLLASHVNNMHGEDNGPAFLCTSIYPAVSPFGLMLYLLYTAFLPIFFDYCIIRRFFFYCEECYPNRV